MSQDQKILNCVKCEKVTPHDYLCTQFIKHEYFSTKQNELKQADGYKEIWICTRCHANRIYGSAISPDTAMSVDDARRKYVSKRGQAAIAR